MNQKQKLVEEWTEERKKEMSIDIMELWWLSKYDELITFNSKLVFETILSHLPPLPNNSILPYEAALNAGEVLYKEKVERMLETLIKEIK